MSPAAADVQELYREVILDHSRNPRQFGRIEKATHTADGINPMCGDRLRLYFRVNGDDVIAASGFEGTGCAISVASASLLTEAVVGETVAAARTWVTEVKARLDSTRAQSELAGDLARFAALDGVREYPARIKCATLAWRTLEAAFDNAGTPVSTE